MMRKYKILTICIKILIALVIVVEYGFTSEIVHEENAVERLDLEETSPLFNHVVQDFNEHAFENYGAIHSDCTKPLGVNYDTSKIPVENKDVFTLCRLGLTGFDVREIAKYFRNDDRHKYQSPGILLLSNGPVNDMQSILPASFNFKKHFTSMYVKSIQNSFSYEREALVNLVLLKHFYSKGLPIQVWSTICYGWQSVTYTLHALTSDDQIAQDIRKTVDVDRILAQELLNQIKLIRIQSPTIKAIDPIERITQLPAEYATKGCLVGMACAGIYTNLNHQDRILPLLSCGLSMLYRYNAEQINANVNRFFAYCGHSYVMPYISHMDEYSRDGLQLLYDLRKNGKTFKNITLFVSWQAHDTCVKPLSVDNLQLYADMFNFYGIGSFGYKHEEESFSQIAYSNEIRKIAGAAYYDDANLEEKGKHIFDSLEIYRRNNDWNGLKRYSETCISHLM